MNGNTPKSATGAGAIIALLTLVGTIGGGYIFRQPSIGLLAGFGLGSLIALILWWRERAR